MTIYLTGDPRTFFTDNQPKSAKVFAIVALGWLSKKYVIRMSSEMDLRAFFTLIRINSELNYNCNGKLV